MSMVLLVDSTLPPVSPKKDKRINTSEMTPSLRSDNSNYSTSFISEKRSFLRKGRSFQSTASAPGRKKIYDMNTNKYIEVSELEFYLAEHEKAVARLAKVSKYHELNIDLSSFGGFEKVFTPESIQVLRHTYFENLRYEEDQFEDPGRRKQSDSQNSEVSTSDSLFAPGIETELSSIYHQEVNDNPFLAPVRDIYGMFNKLDSVYDNVESNRIRNTSIGKLLKDNTFWNTCYKELRFESLTSDIDYYSLLPPQHEMISFHIEFLEFFLNNIQILAAKYDDVVDPTTLVQLKQSFFIYFKDKDYEQFKVMRNRHFKMFKNNGLANHRNHTSFWDSEGANKENELAQLYSKLLDIIIQNIKSSVNTKITMKSIPLWELWQGAFSYIFFELLDEDNEILNKDSDPLNGNGDQHSIILDSSSVSMPISISSNSIKQHPSRREQTRGGTLRNGNSMLVGAIQPLNGISQRRPIQAATLDAVSSTNNTSNRDGALSTSKTPLSNTKSSGSSSPKSKEKGKKRRGLLKFLRSLGRH
ncbi:uncharacterized protein J8A68_005585 [[Candida] subhashii]|uniref:Uncharacterized protein n=1 Tax=[Candida] subhashii TaxID=561895 RepID=A0A8J5QLV5_9ASCO|nr:uncharacterized protein J8A68_005585 [[Candida] subhashii]KAG7660910.1 hypothetical protein J8A68_005585 [[Candida] subhashii]